MRITESDDQAVTAQSENNERQSHSIDRYLFSGRNVNAPRRVYSFLWFFIPMALLSLLYVWGNEAIKIEAEWITTLATVALAVIGFIYIILYLVRKDGDKTDTT